MTLCFSLRPDENFVLIKFWNFDLFLFFTMVIAKLALIFKVNLAVCLRKKNEYNFGIFDQYKILKNAFKWKQNLHHRNPFVTLLWKKWWVSVLVSIYEALQIDV